MHIYKVAEHLIKSDKRDTTWVQPKLEASVNRNFVFASNFCSRGK